MADRETATGELGLIQAFVNTLDLMPRDEELKDPNTLGDWLVARGLMDQGQPVDESDLKHAIAVREAMRGLIGANSGLRVYPVDLATLTRAARPRGAAGRPQLRGGGGGVGGGGAPRGGSPPAPPRRGGEFVRRARPSGGLRPPPPHCVGRS